MRTTAKRDGDDYVIDGAKAWVTHGGNADLYKVMARTSDDRNGISCFLVPADTPGLVADPPERKMGLTGSSTATILLVLPSTRGRSSKNAVWKVGPAKKEVCSSFSTSLSAPTSFPLKSGREGASAERSRISKARA